MRVVPFVACVSAVALMASASSAFAQSNPQFGLAGIALEGVILHRGDLGRTPLTTGAAPVRYHDLDPETAGGLRLKLDGWLFGQRTVYSVLGAWGFDGSLLNQGVAAGTNAAYVPSPNVDVTNSTDFDTLQAKSQSYLFSTDSAAYWFGGSPDRPGLNFIAGSRSIVIDERLKTAAFQNPIGSDTEIDRVKVDVANWATGLQIGVEGYTYVAPGFKLGGFVKGGLLANFVDAETRFSSDNKPANTLTKSYDSIEFAQFVEVSGRVSYEISPNMEFTASAMMLYVNGIAEAGGQYSSAATNTARHIDADSDALYYGATLGLTYKFN